MSYTKYILISGKVSKPYPTWLFVDHETTKGTIGYALFDRRT